MKKIQEHKYYKKSKLNTLKYGATNNNCYVGTLVIQILAYFILKFVYTLFNPMMPIMDKTLQFGELRTFIEI